MSVTFERTPRLESLCVPPVFKFPSERSRSATWEEVELRIVNVLVPAPVKSSVLFPPAQVSVAGFKVSVSVVASPNVVFPSTVKSAETVVVATVVDPATIRLFPYISPSLSTANLTLPETAMPSILVSAVTEEGLR